MKREEDDGAVWDAFPDELYFLGWTGCFTGAEENLGRKIRVLRYCGIPVLLHLDWLEPDYDPKKEDFSDPYCCFFYRDKDRHLMRDPCNGVVTDERAIYHSPLFWCSVSCCCLGFPFWYLCCVDRKGDKDPDGQYGKKRGAGVSPLGVLLMVAFLGTMVKNGQPNA